MFLESPPRPKIVSFSRKGGPELAILAPELPSTSQHLPGDSVVQFWAMDGALVGQFWVIFQLFPRISRIPCLSDFSWFQVRCFLQTNTTGMLTGSDLCKLILYSTNSISANSYSILDLQYSVLNSTSCKQLALHSWMQLSAWATLWYFLWLTSRLAG